jgi:hypothetical protein
LVFCAQVNTIIVNFLFALLIYRTTDLSSPSRWRSSDSTWGELIVNFFLTFSRHECCLKSWCAWYDQQSILWLIVSIKVVIVEATNAAPSTGEIRQCIVVNCKELNWFWRQIWSVSSQPLYYSLVATSCS